MSEEPYTPTLDYLRRGYEEWRALRGSKKYPDELFAEFDRAIARVRAEALTFTEEQVEAVAKAIAKSESVTLVQIIRPEVRERYRKFARAALSAITNQKEN